MMKTLVIQKMLLVDKNEKVTEELEREVYQDIWIPTPISEIPKIPQGKEPLWVPEGDPIVELTVQKKEIDTKISNVLYAVWDNVHKLYPDEYAKAWNNIIVVKYHKINSWTTISTKFLFHMIVQSHLIMLYQKQQKLQRCQKFLPD